MAVDQNLSSRINLMRILLISGIVFVHVPFDPQTSPFNGTFGLFDWVRVFLGDSFFRIGVPCLSAISGYLLFRRGLMDFDYGKTLRSKAKTVLTPFLLWNLALFLVVLLLQRFGIGIGYFPDLWQGSPRELLSHAFALESFPIDLPLYFLRDLLVCIILSPLLALLVRKAPVLTCAALFVIAIVPDLTVAIVLKKSILFSFTFGIALAMYRIDVKALDRFALVGVGTTVLAAAILAIGLYRTGPDFPFWLNLARNILSIVGALGFWLLSALLIRTRIGRSLSETGSLSFWIFCAHYPLLVGMWMVWNRLAGDSNYPLFYFGAIAASFAILVLTNRAAAHWAPPLYRLLTGSRSRSRAGHAEGPGRVQHAAARAPHGAALTQQQR